MKKVKQNLLFFLLLSFHFQFVIAQEKVEIELGVPKRQIPQEINSIIDGYYPNAKKDYVKERYEEGTNYEIKVKTKNEFLSIEFDTSGQFLDFEQWIQLKEFEEQQISKEINSDLKKAFHRYKITKVQKQYKGDLEEIIGYVSAKKESKTDLLIGYELVVFGKNEDSMRYFEFFYSPNGKRLSKSPIRNSNTDNLLY